MTQTVNVPGVGPVNFPDSMSQADIVAAIESDVLPQAVPSPAGSKFQQTFKPPAPGFFARVGRGAMDVGDRLTQLHIAAGEKLGLPGYPEGLGDIATAQMNAERAKYQQGREANGKTGADPARFLGSAMSQVALMPGLGASTTGARILTGAFTGAESGLLQYDPTNSFKQGAKNTGVGAGVGAVMTPLVGKATDQAPKLWGWAAGRVKGAVETLKGNATEEAVLKAAPELAAVRQQNPQGFRDLLAEAQASLRQTGQIDAEALSRKANLIANGVTPTTSMVTRDPRAWTIERNLQKLSQSPDEQIAGTGQALTSVYQGNDRALSDRMASFSSELPKGTAERQGAKVMESLANLSDASQREVSRIYGEVRDAVGDQLASDARNVISTLKSPDVADNAYAEKATASIAARLQRYGLLDAKGEATTQTMTVSQAEEFRKFLGALKDGADPREARVVQQFIKATDEDVLSGYGSQAFGAARTAARERFAMLDNPATQRALNAWGELQQGKTAQTFIRSQVVNGSERDVQSLVTTLGKLPADKAGEALGALKAGLLEHLQGKAINPNSGQFSGAALNKELLAIGDDKLKAVLGETQLQQLKSLARAALDATYQPPFAAVNSSNTAPMLLSLTQRARAIPGVPLLVSEEAQKVAAQSGYGAQLQQALAAAARAKPSIPPLLARASGDAAQAAGLVAPIAGNALLDERRKRANGGR